MKYSKKLLTVGVGILAVLSVFPTTFAATGSITQPIIPPSGQSRIGQGFLNPNNGPYQAGSLTQTDNVQAFYPSNPYSDSTVQKKEVYWDHPNSSWVNSSQPTDNVSFGLSQAIFQDGSSRIGDFYSYNIDRLNSNNGYPLVAQGDIPAWVDALGGNQEYVNAKLDTSSFMDDGVDQWNVASLQQMALDCGWKLEFDNATDMQHGGDTQNGLYVVNSDQATATPTFKLYPSQPPTALLKTDKTDYSQGDTVQITMQPTISTPETTWHEEAVYITGPNNFKQYLPWDTVALMNADGSTTSEGTNIAVAKGTDFPYYGQTQSTLQQIYGGAGQWDNSQTYLETAHMDTSSLSQGQYTVHYVLYDAIGRQSVSMQNGEMTATFNIGPGKESIHLTPPSETVQSGQSVNLSYAVTGMQPGDTVKVVPSGNGVGMWQVSGDTKATDSASETEASTTNQISVSYTAVVIDKNGNQVASDSTTITWQPGQPTPPLNPNDDKPGAWQYPVSQPQDYGVNLSPELWDHWPRMGDTGHVTVKILNNAWNLNKDRDWVGGYIDYTFTATSNNPYFQPITKTGEVFVAPPSGGDGDLTPSETDITIPYTVSQRQDPRNGYIIQFKVRVNSVGKTIHGKPPTYIPALSDADPNNDSAQYNLLIPAAPILTK